MILIVVDADIIIIIMVDGAEIIRGAREDLRVGVPARTRFRPAEILFYFALIGDCRLGHQNKKYKIKGFHRPPAPEFQESMTPKEFQIKEKSMLQYFDCLPTKLDTWCRHSIWKIISASRRIFWDGFQPFLKNRWFSVSLFLLQYFDCLPTQQDTWCCHSIWKIISASRRIFWDGFQRFFKNIWHSVSFCSCFSISIVHPLQ